MAEPTRKPEQGQPPDVDREPEDTWGREPSEQEIEADRQAAADRAAEIARIERETNAAIERERRMATLRHPPTVLEGSLWKAGVLPPAPPLAAVVVRGCRLALADVSSTEPLAEVADSEASVSENRWRLCILLAERVEDDRAQRDVRNAALVAILALAQLDDECGKRLLRPWETEPRRSPLGRALRPDAGLGGLRVDGVPSANLVRDVLDGVPVEEARLLTALGRPFWGSSPPAGSPVRLRTPEEIRGVPGPYPSVVASADATVAGDGELRTYRKRVLAADLPLAGGLPDGAVLMDDGGHLTAAVPDAMTRSRQAAEVPPDAAEGRSVQRPVAVHAKSVPPPGEEVRPLAPDRSDNHQQRVSEDEARILAVFLDPSRRDAAVSQMTEPELAASAGLNPRTLRRRCEQTENALLREYWKRRRKARGPHRIGSATTSDVFDRAALADAAEAPDPNSMEGVPRGHVPRRRRHDE